LGGDAGTKYQFIRFDIVQKTHIPIH